MRQFACRISLLVLSVALAAPAQATEHPNTGTYHFNDFIVAMNGTGCAAMRSMFANLEWQNNSILKGSFHRLAPGKTGAQSIFDTSNDVWLGGFGIIDWPAMPAQADATTWSGTLSLTSTADANQPTLSATFNGTFAFVNQRAFGFRNTATYSTSAGPCVVLDYTTFIRTGS